MLTSSSSLIWKSIGCPFLCGFGCFTKDLCKSFVLRSSGGLSWFSRAAEAGSGPFAEPGDHPFDALLPFRSPDFGAGLQSPNHCSIVVAEGAPNPEIVKGPVVLLSCHSRRYLSARDHDCGFQLLTMR